MSNAQLVTNESDNEPSVLGAGHVPIPMPTQADRREAYKQLYVARMVARVGLSEEDAAACFEAGSDDIDYSVDPEDAADDEMSYWENDGD